MSVIYYTRHPTEIEPATASNEKATLKEEEKLQHELEKETKLTLGNIYDTRKKKIILIF